ncbi:MAG: hypothetical protein LBM77_10690 [Spirochaetaceae bacterium]|jgi:hypothetical protein|nr:hypothetical protein [Spirochaetaceae bacterium]
MTIHQTTTIPRSGHLDVPLPEIFRPGVEVTYTLNIQPIYTSNDDLDRRIDKIALERIEQNTGHLYTDFDVRGKKARENPTIDENDGWE